MTFALVVFLTSRVPAQDSDQLPSPVAPPTSAGAFPGEEVVLDRLAGLAVYPSESAASAAMPAEGLALAAVPLLDTPDYRAIAGYFLDAPVSLESLRRLESATRIYLSAIGYPFSLVYTPQQDITAGRVRLVVTVSRLEKTVAVEGAHHFSADLYRDAIRQRPGESLDRAQLQADLAWLNRHPFRAAAAETAPGTTPGTTRIVLRVQERRPWQVFAGAGNGGTETTTIERFNAGFNWGNAFGLGHQLSAQWTSSWDFEALRSVSGSYALDLPWRHSLSLTGAYSQTQGVLAPPFSLAGESWQAGLNYDVPLTSPRDGYTHALQFGADFKASDNNFMFADMPISDNLTHVAQIRATYRGRITSGWGATAFGATVVAAPGGLTDRNADAYFNLSRAGAKAGYVYLRAHASHRVALDRIKTGLAWLIRGEVQLSPWSNLIGSEQFGGGGAYSVRGYEEGEVYKDNGGLLSHELRLPPWSPRLGRGRLADTLQLYVFHDYAHLWSTDRLPGESAVDLHSAGVGFDYFMGPRLNLRAAYGWQFTASGSSDTGDRSRAHLSARVSF